MSELSCKQNDENAKADMTKCRDEIGRLYLEGYATRDIAAKLGGKTLDVARNLREVRKRWERAARRQQAVLPARCAEICNEAIDAWRRSQQPKVTTTTEVRDNKPTRVTTRTVQGPGDKGFLTAALSSFKFLSQCTAKKPAEAVEVHDQELNEIRDMMTPEQLEQLKQMKREYRRQARQAEEQVCEEVCEVGIEESCENDGQREAEKPAEVVEVHDQVLNEIREMLTPEQLEQLKELQSENRRQAEEEYDADVATQCESKTCAAVAETGSNGIFRPISASTQFIEPQGSTRGVMNLRQKFLARGS